MGRFNVAPISSDLFDKPVCPKCGQKMWLAQLRPADEPHHDLRIFECPVCEISERLVVGIKDANPSTMP